MATTLPISTMPLARQPRTRRTIVLWQRVSRFLSTVPWLFMCRSFRLDLAYSDIDVKHRYIVASNHQSRLDAFTLLAAMPNDAFSRLGPFRALTMNTYFRLPWTRFCALGMGCFPAKDHPTLPHGLSFAEQVLTAGQVVYIAPEGGICRRGERPARPGVATLAQLPHVMIIPAHIEWRRGRLWRTFKLGIGKPFDGSTMTAEQIMDRIYAQPVD